MPRLVVVKVAGWFVVTPDPIGRSGSVDAGVRAPYRCGHTHLEEIHRIGGVSLDLSRSG